MFPKGKHRHLKLGTALALILTLSGIMVAAAQDDGREELDEGLALLGIFVGAEERDATDVIVEDGKFLLPAEETFKAINTRLRKEENGTFLDTPIGSIEIATGTLRETDDGTFIGEDFLIEMLSTPVSFDIEFYAVVLEPPWDPDDPLKTDGDGDAEIEPDVVPPIIGMTSAHGDVFTTFTSASDEVGMSSQLELNGHGLGGVWRLRYSGSLDNHELADYAWLREVTDNIWTMVGRQQVGVHPLIDVVDMTGAQFAYSNRPEAFEQIEDVGGILLDRAGGTGRRFVGEGPAGGRVELVIDGLVVSEALIGVNGTYTIDSPLLGQRRSDVEVRVFEALSDNQVDSVQVTLTANRFLAPKGSFNIVGGAGIEGDFLDTDGDSGEPTGFARARYAPLEDLTLEAAVAFDPDDGLEGAIGAAVQLGKIGTAYVSAGIQDDGSKSVEGLYYGEFGKLTATGRVRYRETDGADEDDVDDQGERAEIHDHYAEVAYEYSNRLRFGAVARHNINTTYALPFVTWRPRKGLSLSARPNRDGEYRLEARAQPFRDISLQVFYEGDGFARVAYNFETETTGRSEASIEANYSEADGGFGAAIGLQGDRLFGLPVTWRLRGERDEASMTGSIGLRHEVRPGISVYADGGMRQFRSNQQDEVFGSLGLSFDLGLAKNQFTAAPRQGTNPRMGRLAGRIDVPEGIDLEPEDINGARIIVDGKPLGRIEDDGSFWISRVRTGVRTVRLEADKLPIDLVIDSKTINAKIAPGAVTPVDFKLAVEVGTAGRITGPEGEPVIGVPLQMINADGEVISSSRSNQFGLFRMDGLRPGQYKLKALDIWEGASREVEIGSEYVFGTDMSVTKPSKPQEASETVTQP